VPGYNSGDDSIRFGDTTIKAIKAVTCAVHTYNVVMIFYTY
jgi:hypothetical protein